MEGAQVTGCLLVSQVTRLTFQCVHAQLLQSCPTLCEPMDLAHQAPLSIGFSREELWSGVPCPPAGDLPDNTDGTKVSYVSCIGRWVLLH